MAYTWALLVAGDWDGAEVRLREAEGSVRPESADPDVVGQIYAARAYVMVYQGDVDRAAELANQAVELLSGDEPFLYGIAMFVLGMTHYFSEGVVAADRAFSRAVDLAQDSGGTLVSMLSIYATGFLKLMQGYLGQARDLFQRGLRLVDADRRRVAAGGRDVPSPGLALMYQGLGEVMREQNKLDEAERYLTQCIERAEAWGNAEVLVDSYVFLARLGMSRGDFDAAHRTIERAVQLVREGQVSPLTSRQVMAHRARLYVAERNLAPAVRWAASLERSVPPAEDVGRITSYVRGVEQLALARLLVAQRDYPRALDLLATLLDATEAFQWVWHTIEVLALQAVVHYSLGETEQALRVLERALRLAEPEGYVRIFVEAGAPMADLLRRAAARGITPAYAAQLLAAFRPEGALPQELAPRPVVAESPLVEPLSSREIEVLQLVVDGLSNREIAERLVIAVSTVKTHINHIYRKLDVTSLTQAVARARALDLA